MYHYLKWAALGLFFRRNMRYLVFIAAGFVGIYIADAIYEDMADFAVKTGETGAIGSYLLIKWLVVLVCGGLILFSVMRLGFGSDAKRVTKEKKRGGEKQEIPGNDPIMKRLEKFRRADRLRHRSDLIIEKKRRGK